MKIDWDKKITAASLDPTAGFLFINKPAGWTSHDVVAKLRSTLKIKKIGHAGTLDPLATGLLIIGIGKATTLLDYWHQFPKTYQAEMELGKISDTFDILGDIKTINDQETITKDKLTPILNSFSGKQLQTPPPFSAKKIKGKKAYELARQGKKIKLAPREIEIFKCKLLNFQNNLVSFEVVCSTGTYLRTLINDLGKKLLTGAIMTGLQRTAIGPISLPQAQSPEEITIENYYDYLFTALDELTN